MGHIPAANKQVDLASPSQGQSWLVADSAQVRVRDFADNDGRGLPMMAAAAVTQPGQSNCPSSFWYRLIA
jgi:hypothetical protein